MRTFRMSNRAMSGHLRCRAYPSLQRPGALAAAIAGSVCCGVLKLLHTAHVPPGPGPFPTVLALHGFGASAHDLVGLAPLLHGGEALVICPQGPVSLQLGPGADGYGWFPPSGGGIPDPSAHEQAAKLLLEFADEAFERYPAGEKRVLLGFSQGGVLAYEVFLRERDRFSGVVALSTWLPARLAEGAAAATASDPPVLVMHGTRDPMIDVERAREARKLLLERGVSLTYREYDMGHEIAPDALRDLVEWLEDKVFQPIRLT